MKTESLLAHLGSMQLKYWFGTPAMDSASCSSRTYTGILRTVAACVAKCPSLKISRGPAGLTCHSNAAHGISRKLAPRRWCRLE